LNKYHLTIYLNTGRVVIERTFAEDRNHAIRIAKAMYVGVNRVSAVKIG